MKNRTILILTIITLFTTISCKKDDLNIYTGTYTGTLTSTDFVKKDVKLTFTNASNKKTLCLFDIELTKVSENQLNADAKIVLELIHLIDTNITVDIVANASATFVFENEEVTMDMKYSLIGRTSDKNVRYIGKK
jgi:hypothetical protein